MTIKIWENGQINTKNLEIWGRFFENLDNRKVAYDKVGNIIISTVFLGIDHSILDEIESPILFETAIIKGDDIEIEERYTSYEKVIEGHNKYKDLIDD